MSLRRLTFWNLLAQSAIIVTGVTVRVTGSGLGCPTWPQCVPGSYVPTVEQAQTWHKYVEFGNRTLTFVLTAIAVATFVMVWRARPIDRVMRGLATVPFVGTGLQAVLGGITVLTGLHPVTVMAHFLVSVAIVAAAHALWTRTSDQPMASIELPPILRTVADVLVGLALLVIVLGTVVTGSGPHSGDAERPARLGFDPQLMAWIHADAVWLITGIAVALFAYARWVAHDPSLRNSTQRLLIVIGLQAVVGYTQYWTGLPWFLVVLHAALAVTFWISVLQVRSAVRGGISV